jgi:hypothetical protein
MLPVLLGRAVAVGDSVPMLLGAAVGTGAVVLGAGDRVGEGAEPLGVGTGVAGWPGLKTGSTQ